MKILFTNGEKFKLKIQKKKKKMKHFSILILFISFMLTANSGKISILCFKTKQIDSKNRRDAQ